MGADEASLSELLQSQLRPAAWADAAERLIRSKLNGESAITCREFMCRIEIALPTIPAGQR